MRINARGILSAIWALALIAPAAAQAEDQFNVQMFRPSAHAYDLWNTRTTTIAPDLTFGGGLLLHYGRNPLVYVRDLADGSEERHPVIQDQLTADLWGSIALIDHLSIGVGVPIVLMNSGESGFVDFDGGPGGLSGAALGDIRLDIKGTFVRHEMDGVGFGANLVVSFPTNAGNEYAGDDALTFSPQLLLDYNKDGYFLALNGGVRVRTGEGKLDILNVGHELLLGLGVGLPLFEGLLAGAEFQAVGRLDDPFGEENESQIALRGGLRYNFDFGLGLEAGAGGGFLRGYGNNSVHAFFGVRFDPPMAPKDSDLDGLTDDVDACPFEPEDFDGFQDTDGCPDPDNDQDGILDVEDQCPNDPEDKDGFEDQDGCPDPDNDKDGIPDVQDRCPNDPEDKDGFEDEDGCPDLDNDKDGIPDVKDQCPNDPENFNQYQDEDGCPDDAPKARIEGKKIVILDKVFFATDKDVILERSFPVLMEVAKVMNDNPQIKQILIEGHTDSKASNAYNKRLSDRRAKSVRKFLIQQGINQNRMLAKGFGEEKPIATNDTEEGRAENRRVEFTILKMDE
jgi:outer membrane protein OmpA-like peptidoglycan-associated protein